VPQSMLALIIPARFILRPAVKEAVIPAPVILLEVLLQELILRAGVQLKAIQLKVIPPLATRPRITPHRAILLPVTPMLPAR
jgi:hypothetical protein